MKTRQCLLDMAALVVLISLALVSVGMALQREAEEYSSSRSVSRDRIELRNDPTVKLEAIQRVSAELSGMLNSNDSFPCCLFRVPLRIYLTRQ